MEMQYYIRSLNTTLLTYVNDGENRLFWGGGWINSKAHWLVNIKAIKWDICIQELISSNIFLKEYEDKLVLVRNFVIGSYIVKLGYEALFSLD